MKQRVIRQPDIPLASIDDQPTNFPDKFINGKQSFAPSSKDVADVSIAKLRLSPYNSRKIRHPKRITKIAESLKTHGQKDPLYVYPGTGDDEGYFMVLGGETRRLAAIQISLETLKVFIDFEIDVTNALALTKVSNILNDSVDECDLDRAMVVVDLLKKYTQAEVAETMELESRAHIQRLEKLASLPKKFIELGQDYPERFSAKVGLFIDQAITKYSEDFAFEILKLAVIENLAHSKIAKAIETGPADQQPQKKREKRIRRDGGFDVLHNEASCGRYDTYKSKTPGLKVLRLHVEIPSDLAKKLDEEITEMLTRLIHTNTEKNETDIA